MSKKIRKEPPGPQDLNEKNRAYNAKMRDLYYRRAEGHLGTFYQSLRANFLKPDYNELQDFCNALNTSREFAKQTIAGSSRQHRKTEGAGSAPPILQEEIVFLHMLEELYSSSVFLVNRFNTVSQFNSYKRDILAMPKNKDIEYGYLSSIVEFIDETQWTEEEEVRHIVSLIIKRIKLGNRIFAVMKKFKISN